MKTPNYRVIGPIYVVLDSSGEFKNILNLSLLIAVSFILLNDSEIVIIRSRFDQNLRSDRHDHVFYSMAKFGNEKQGYIQVAECSKNETFDRFIAIESGTQKEIPIDDSFAVIDSIMQPQLSHEG